MLTVEFEAATGHDLAPAIMDPKWLLCRFCGQTYEFQYICRMLATDLLTEPECRATAIDIPEPDYSYKCSCGVGTDWEMGHSYWCKLYKSS